MLKINCVIVDDEPFARKGLKNYVSQYPYLNLVTECENILQLKKILETTIIDLIFLDIEMPFITGIDFLRQEKNPPYVVFTTAYNQYAVESYELKVLDYLLKPISSERFMQTAQKCYSHFLNFQENNNKELFVKSNSVLKKISTRDIHYVQSLENYIVIHLHQEKIITHTTLKAFYEKLPGDTFIQIHKSYIININALQKVKTNSVVVNDIELPISKNRKAELKFFLQEAESNKD